MMGLHAKVKTNMHASMRLVLRSVYLALFSSLNEHLFSSEKGNRPEEAFLLMYNNDCAL